MVTSLVPCLIIGELWGPTVRISNQNCCFGCNISVHDTKYGHTVPFWDGMLQGSEWTFSLCWIFRRVYQGTSSPAGSILSSESTVFPVLSKHVCFAENSLLGLWLTVPEERIQCTVSGYSLCQRREFSAQSLVTVCAREGREFSTPSLVNVHQNFSQCPETFSFSNSQASLSWGYTDGLNLCIDPISGPSIKTEPEWNFKAIDSWKPWRTQLVVT